MATAPKAPAATTMPVLTCNPAAAPVLDEPDADVERVELPVELPVADVEPEVVLCVALPVAEPDAVELPVCLLLLAVAVCDAVDVTTAPLEAAELAVSSSDSSGVTPGHCRIQL